MSVQAPLQTCWNIVKAHLCEKVVRQCARVTCGQVSRDAVRDSWPGAV